MPTEAEVKELAYAMWQLLNDFDTGQCCCLAAKARARIAYEPFNDEPDAAPAMTLVEAQAVMARLT